MSSISLSLKMLLGAGALAGFTLLACGEEDSGGGKKDDDGDNEEDKKPDAGGNNRNDAGRRDSSIPTVEVGEPCEGKKTAACEGCGFPVGCLTMCTEDDVWGECKSPLELIPEGGIKFPEGGIRLPEGGITFNPEAGIKINEAGIPTSECPGEYMCASSSSGGITGFIVQAAASQGGAGAGICVTGAAAAPKACTDAADCSEFGAAACFDVGPIISMFPGGDLLFPLTGWPTAFCAAPCEP